MKDKKQSALERLPKWPWPVSWELAILIALLVTVLGVALRAPVKSFPHQDPYDLHPERTLSDSRNRVETGL